MRILIAAFVGLVACGGGKSKPTPVTGGSGAAAAAKKPVTEFRATLVTSTITGASAEGVLRNAATKEALIGATIMVTSAALVGEQVQLTDEKGYFAFTSLPPGDYKLVAYYDDQQAGGQFSVAEGKLAKIALDWALIPANEKGEVVVIAPVEPKFNTALDALKKGALEQAVKLGRAEVAKQPSSTLHGMLAIATYGAAVETLRMEMFASSGEKPKQGKDFRKGMENFAATLDQVQKHLAEAAKDPKFTFEFCVACMATEDGFLAAVPVGAFDIERDRANKPLPEGDKRRRPTYRFDHGDLVWARAMVSYQQALANITLAYDWSFIDEITGNSASVGDAPMPSKITIKLADPARIAKARELLLAGLAASDEARLAYLAETDDDREWVPSPKQKNYASPLAVDTKLYKTWEDVVGDVRSLVAGETGISLKAMWTAFGSKRSEAPAGFIDIGAMLKSPTDIVIEMGAIDRIENEKNAGKRAKMTAAMLKQVLGNGLNPKMKASKLTDRLIQLRKDLDGAETAFEDKLKYVLWLN